MHKKDVPLGLNVIPILVAALCYWIRIFREILPQKLVYDLVVHTTHHNKELAPP